jgi:hypothetical protein
MLEDDYAPATRNMLPTYLSLVLLLLIIAAAVWRWRTD